MKKITLNFADLKKLTQAEFHNFSGSEVFDNVTTDTRTMKAGGIFVAIAGDNFDGHEYIKEAKKKVWPQLFFRRESLRKFRQRFLR